MKYLVGENQFDNFAEAQEYERKLYEANKVDPLDELSYVYRVKNTYTEKEMYLVVFNIRENTTQALRDLVIAYNPNGIATPHLKRYFPFISIEVKAVKDKVEKSKVLSYVKPSMLMNRKALHAKADNLLIVWNKYAVEDFPEDYDDTDDNIELIDVLSELVSFGV